MGQSVRRRARHGNWRCNDQGETAADADRTRAVSFLPGRAQKSGNRLNKSAWKAPGRPGGNGCGRVPDASHAIEVEETDASRTRPEPFLPGAEASRAQGDGRLHSKRVCPTGNVELPTPPRV
eukprot:gene10451-biopygen15333